jgi:hypothetical protein
MFTMSGKGAVQKIVGRVEIVDGNVEASPMFEHPAA